MLRRWFGVFTGVPRRTALIIQKPPHSRTMVTFAQKFTTKSGNPVTIGAGSGTKWQWMKKKQYNGKLTPELVEQLVTALNVGFNHLDTAEFYTTHEEVGEAIRQSGKSREDIFLTTKFHAQTTGRGPLQSVEEALEELGTDYIDLFLVHTPFFIDKEATLESVWKEMVEVKKSGKARYIGVSNYAVPHLETTMAVDPSNPPVVNQIEYHAHCANQSPGIIDFCKQHSIQVEAYGPLSPLFRSEGSPLKPVLEKLAQKYGKTDAQILLRWVYQNGVVPITTSSNANRLKQALDIVNFELDQADHDEITSVGASFPNRNFFEEQFAEVEKSMK
ncbi:NADPH-dependent alpha-keto amide reductase [Diutina catenulata]